MTKTKTTLNTLQFMLILSGCIFFSSSAFAYDLDLSNRAFDLERLRLTTDSKGLMDVESGEMLAHLELNVGLWVSYSNDSLVLSQVTNSETKRLATLLGNRVTGHLNAALGLFDWSQIGIELPMVMMQQGDARVDVVNVELSQLSSAGLGDMRIVSKTQVLNSYTHFIDGSIILHMTLPTTTAEAYLGEPGFSITPEIALSGTLPAMTFGNFVFKDFQLAGNLAYAARPQSALADLTIDDELLYRGAMSYSLEPLTKLPLLAHMNMSGGLNPFNPVARRNETPLEFSFGASYRLPDFLKPLVRHDTEMRLVGAMGVGLIGGHGTPDLRAFVGLQTSQPLPRDVDGDGIRNMDDPCPEAPEDFDDFEDEDGCPDPDNDQDGVEDDMDECPFKFETQNNFEDEDGCPDEAPDEDGDGIADAIDVCIDEPEDNDGFEDLDGCPESGPDTDSDGILDEFDKCVEAAEDMDGFEDEDGCPDYSDSDSDGIDDQKDQCPDVAGPIESYGCPDRDADGFNDPVDLCPNEAGVKEFNGCASEQLLYIEDDRIILKTKIDFGAESGPIPQDALPALDRLAQLLKDRPTLRIEVGAHTDNQGKRMENLFRSQRQAGALIAYLSEKGINADRLEARGYGQNQPIMPNMTKKGRDKNRRVEFIILSATKVDTSSEKKSESAPPLKTETTAQEKPEEQTPAPTPEKEPEDDGKPKSLLDSLVPDF
ncbi:MAG: hypothetical protein CMH60_02385 [Myxococcales bacterium]|nr:hypothetical protein [Myxococcales bacterium]